MLAVQLQAQNIQGDQFVCPNGTIVKTYQLPDPRPCDAYLWWVSGPSSGYRIDGSKENSSLTVRFFDNGNFRISLRIVNPGGTNCDNIYNNTTTSLDVQAGYGSAPANSDIIISRNLDFCSTEPMTLSTKFYRGAQYKWTIPAGWTSSNLNLRTITVVPNGLDGGVVSVDTYFPARFLYNEDCIDNFDPEYHHPLIQRSISLRNTRLSSISGPSTFNGGSKTPVILKANPSLPRASSYQWTLPCGWTASNGQTGTINTPVDSIVVIPSGLNGGQIKVQAILTCGNSDRSSNEVIKTVSLTAGTEPRISGPGVLCSSGSYRYTLQNVPAGTSATWSATPASLFVTSSGPGESFSTRANGTQANGSGTVRASLSNSCGNILDQSIWVGIPGIVPDHFGQNTNLRVVPNHLYGQSPFPCTSHISDIEYYWEVHPDDRWRIKGAGQHDIRWAPDNFGYASYTQEGSYGLSFYLTRPFDPYSNGYARLEATNVCGTRGVVGAGWGRCSNFSQSYTLHPNPTSDYINITMDSLEAHTVDLYLMNHRLETIENHAYEVGSPVDVSKLPPGPYYIKLLMNNETKGIIRFIKE